MKKWLVPIIALIVTVLFILKSHDYPTQLTEHMKLSENGQAIFIENSFCLSCPDGDFLIEIAADENNVIFIDEGWSTNDIDNFTRALQPESSIVVSSEELKYYFLKNGKKIGNFYSIQL